MIKPIDLKDKVFLYPEFPFTYYIKIGHVLFFMYVIFFSWEENYVSVLIFILIYFWVTSL